jgi:hypothetical protein
MARNHSSTRSQKQSSETRAKKNPVNGNKTSGKDRPSTGFVTQAAEPVTRKQQPKNEKLANPPAAVQASSSSPLKRAASAVGRAVAKITGRSQSAKAVAPSPAMTATTERKSRPIKRESDIVREHLTDSYSPTQTSLRAPFRSSGDDRERDQEFAGGIDDNRWKDEDRLTNKSGDPRIGTHNRTYEPQKAVAADDGYETE